MDSQLYTYLQLPEDYWVVTTTMDNSFEYVTSDGEDESK